MKLVLLPVVVYHIFYIIFVRVFIYFCAWRGGFVCHRPRACVCVCVYLSVCKCHVSACECVYVCTDGPCDRGALEFQYNRVFCVSKTPTLALLFSTGKFPGWSRWVPSGNAGANQNHERNVRLAGGGRRNGRGRGRKKER